MKIWRPKGDTSTKAQNLNITGGNIKKPNGRTFSIVSGQYSSNTAMPASTPGQAGKAEGGFAGEVSNPKEVSKSI